MTRIFCLLAAWAALATGSVQASVQISSDPTNNMNCVAGVCTPAAEKAVLNVDDLANFLSSGHVEIATGADPKTIGVVSPLTWGSLTGLRSRPRNSFRHECNRLKRTSELSLRPCASTTVIWAMPSPAGA